MAKTVRHHKSGNNITYELSDYEFDEDDDTLQAMGLVGHDHVSERITQPGR